MIELHFLQQCCDAVEYLEMGAKCAESTICYDTLRPTGALLWFSLPTRLGLPNTILIYAHLILLLLSIGLSTLSMKSLFPALTGLAATSLTFTASTIAHLFFFVPVLFVSLSDAPAGLLALCSIWTLLATTHQAPSPTRNGIAGALLGIAAWMRAAYLPGLLATIPIMFFYRNKRAASAFIIAALLPALLQLASSFAATGSVAYLDEGSVEHTMSTHWFTPVSGYDTLLPRHPHFLENSCQYSPENKWQDPVKVAMDTACFIQAKTYFNFGSYSWHAYITGDQPSENATPLPLLFARAIPQVFHIDTSTPLESYRYWSHGLLLANLAAILAFVSFVIGFRRHFNAGGWAACFLIAAWTGICFIIVTEQRFLIAPMTCFWLIGFCYLFSCLLQRNLTEQKLEVQIANQM